MRKKMILQYRCCILAVEKKKHFSYLGSSSRESTNGIAANYVLLNVLGTIYNIYTMGNEEINPSTTYRTLSKT